MGKLIVSMMTSVDSFIEGPNRELDWKEVQALKRRAKQDCFVFGGAGIIASLR